MYLKEKQLEGIGNFFLDVGKGVFLGTLGTSIFNPLGSLTTLANVSATFFCVLVGVYFLGKME